VQAPAFDITAPTFERPRALPDGVPEAIRRAILCSVGVKSPRLLDVGAGTGRIGAAFVAAGDDYVGVDLSFAMLCAFAQRGTARLVQAASVNWALAWNVGTLSPRCEGRSPNGRVVANPDIGVTQIAHRVPRDPLSVHARRANGESA
jgi:SAM-dependent methyltransferase